MPEAFWAVTRVMRATLDIVLSFPFVGGGAAADIEWGTAHNSGRPHRSGCRPGLAGVIGPNPHLLVFYLCRVFRGMHRAREGLPAPL
jgi:hypothetical protein